jgi:hypothetical protein
MRLVYSVVGFLDNFMGIDKLCMLTSTSNNITITSNQAITRGSRDSMRKLTSKARAWLKKRAIDEEKRKLSRRTSNAKIAEKLTGFIRIPAPETFEIANTETRNTLLYFIASLKQKIINGNRKIYIDFVHTRRFRTGGAILLLAEISRLTSAYGDMKFRSSCPRTPKAAQVMKQIGLAKLLRTNVSVSVKDHDVANWKCATGQGALGEKCDAILGPYEGIIAEALSDDLYRGLTEAMTNAHHHAYISPRGDGIVCDESYKPWWMFSQEKDGYLTVIFCDLGVGIPATLPIKQAKWWQYASRLGIDMTNEGKLIQGAVRNSQSRTRLLHRGKGLRQIADTVRASSDGQVSIYSNKGLYTLANGKEKTFNHVESIMGTVIQWRMPLPQRA